MDSLTPPPPDRVLLDFLAQRNVPCPACSYNLRGLETSTCPECGNQLQLTVGVVGNLSSNWIVALVASLLPAGVGLPFQILLLFAMGDGIVDLFSDILREPQGVVFLLLVLYSLFCIPVVITLLAKRRWYVSLRKETQGVIGGALIMFDVIAALVALILIGSIM